MPIFDLPLAELATYQGRNPKPVDFDAFWDRALSELDAVDARVQVEAVAHPSPTAECFDLWFSSVGEGRVYAKYLRPRDPAQRRGPAVVAFHGYAGRSADWFALIPYVAQGYTVVAMDVRGQGGRSEDLERHPGGTLHGHIVRGVDGTPEQLMYRSIYLDCVQAIRVAMQLPDVDATRVGVTGGSQGGALALASAALEPRVKAVASLYPFLSDFLRVWEMDLAENAYAELRDHLRRFDPRHERVVEFFTRLGYIDVQHLAPRITARLLMFTGLMDRICPPSTQFAAYNRISSPKEMVLYPDYEHVDLPGASDRILGFFEANL